MRFYRFYFNFEVLGIVTNNLVQDVKLVNKNVKNVKGPDVLVKI